LISRRPIELSVCEARSRSKPKRGARISIAAQYLRGRASADPELELNSEPSRHNAEGAKMASILVVSPSLKRLRLT
jgi:hypothetical protein